MNYLTAVIMLLICTLVTGYTLSDTVLEARLSTNGLSSEQVAAVARAGLAEGLARLADIEPSLPADFSGGLAEQGIYRVRYAWRRQAAPQVLDVIAEGRASDTDASVRTVVQSAVFVPWLIDAPLVPVISRDGVRVAAAVVLRNEDPNAPLIWSGGKAIVPSGFGGRLDDSDLRLRALDTAGWIEAAFSTSPARVRELAGLLSCTACDLSVVDPPRMFMVHGGSGPASLRTSDPDRGPAGPLIAFIDGDLELDSPLAFDGLLFVTGSVVVDHPSVAIRGALVAGGDVALRAGSVMHAPGVLEVLHRRGYFAPLPGSRHERVAGG
ncbi:MAG: hypothetical protein GC138_03395 [Gammaproteobacteria bacterium]|nr:hypothetical protein [Gammaproteobacteria bacterium]